MSAVKFVVKKVEVLFWKTNTGDSLSLRIAVVKGKRVLQSISSSNKRKWKPRGLGC